MKAYYAKKIIGEDREYHNAYLIVDQDKIADIRETADDCDEVTDYSDYTIMPGIFDIHSHGCFGYSGTNRDYDEIFGYTKAMASRGVTTMFPAIMYEPGELEAVKRVVDVIESDRPQGARILGIQAEGPYRAKEYMGASKGRVWPEPSEEYTRKMLEVSGGHMKYISISPELPNIYESMEILRENGVIIAAGHTGVNYEEMNRAFAAGVKTISHFGNAIRMVHQRDANAAGAALLNDDILIELICDHRHVCKETVDIFMRFKDTDHILLISDSSELAGLPKGKYFARNKYRYVDENGIIRIEDGTLSGGGKGLLYGIENMVKHHNVSLVDAVKMGGYNQAKLFGYQDTIGSLRKGKNADFFIMDDNWEVIRTYREGKEIYDIKDKDSLYNPLMTPAE